MNGKDSSFDKLVFRELDLKVPSQHFSGIDDANQEHDQIRRSEEFFKKMESRRSIRSFSSTPIDRMVLINAIKTAGSSPSGANRQPWHFALITSRSVKERIRKAAEDVEQAFYSNESLVDWVRDLEPLATNSVKPYLSEAPALIAIFSRNSCESENGTVERSYYPVESTGIATGFLLTALHNAGLATLTHTPRPMFFLNEILGMDRTFRPFMIVVTGYATQPIQVPNIRRKSIDQIMTEF